MIIRLWFWKINGAWQAASNSQDQPGFEKSSSDLFNNPVVYLPVFAWLVFQNHRFLTESVVFLGVYCSGTEVSERSILLT
jgi:hypothetical protein